MMLDWDWKDRSTNWLQRRLRYVKDELDDGECTPCRTEQYQRQERVIQREIDRRARIEANPPGQA